MLCICIDDTLIALPSHTHYTTGRVAPMDLTELSMYADLFHTLACTDQPYPCNPDDESLCADKVAEEIFDIADFYYQVCPCVDVGIVCVCVRVCVMILMLTIFISYYTLHTTCYTSTCTPSTSSVNMRS